MQQNSQPAQTHVQPANNSNLSSIQCSTRSTSIPQSNPASTFHKAVNLNSSL